MDDDTAKKEDQAKRIEARKLLKQKIRELEERLEEKQDELRGLLKELDNCDEDLKEK